MTPGLVFDWRGELPTMYGRDAMLEFYERAWLHFDETLTPSAFEVRGDILRTTPFHHGRINHIMEIAQPTEAETLGAG